LEDARIVRSRKALHGALLKLIVAKPFNEVTVRDITAAANIGYATFFRHYPSKEALLEAAAANELRQVLKISMPIIDAGDSRASCVTLCTYVHKNRALWSALLAGGAQQTMREELIRVSRENALTRSKPGVPTEVAIMVCVGSIVEILSWWLRQSDIAIDQAADLLNDLAVVPILDKFL